MNQELFEKHVCNQNSHYEKYRWCCVPQLSFETEVSIALLFKLCSTRYTAVQIKNCLKSTSVIKVDTEKYDGAVCPSYCLKPLPFSVSYVQLVT